jgi:predicted PurR-regulated permease PerM
LPKSARRQRIQLLFLILLTVFTLYLSYLIARPFLTAIVIAAVLAVAMQPACVEMRKRMSKGSAAMAATLLVLFAVLLPSIWVGNTVAHEVAQVYDSLNQQQAQQGSWREYVNALLDRPLGWIATHTGVPQDRLKTEVMSGVRDLSAGVLQWAKSLVVNIGAILVDLVIVLVTLFFFLRDGERFRKKIGSLLPIASDRYQQLVDIINESITANVYGVLAVAVAQGLLGLIGYLIAGLPSVMLWSLMTGLSSMVPVLGTACVWGVGCLYLLLIGSWGKAIFLLAYGAGVISMADSVVRPWVLSGRVQLHSLLILFSLLGGAAAFGVVGLFLGPIVVSVTMALLQMLREEQAGWEDGLELGEANPSGRDEGIL